MALCYSSRLSFRFQKYRSFLFRSAILRPFSTTTLDKRLKTIDDLPGHPNYFGFGMALQILLAKIITKKPLGKIILELQFVDVEKFGPIHKVELPGIKLVNLVDPIEVAKVLRNDPKYPRRADFPVLNYYRELSKTIPGIFFANGEDWYRYRSVVSQRILRPREVSEYVPVLNDITTDFVTRLHAIRMPAGGDAEQEVKDIDNELFKWSFESVSHVLFDKRFGCLGDEVNPDAQDFIKSVGGFLAAIIEVGFTPVWFYKMYETKRFKEFVFHFDNMYKYAELFISQKVQELESEKKLDAAKDPEKVGFVEFLLSNEKLSRDDLIASIIDLLFAGVDTTSNTMQWFLYMMAKNQDKQEKLFQEVTMVLEPDELPSAKTLAKMPYLKACLKETLRLFPVLSATSRLIQTDMEILGYHIPKGTQVQFLNYYMGRNESNFKEANEFIPERWLRTGKREVADSDQAFASIPFGFGTRMCVGRRVAELELYLLATRLIQKYKIKYPDNEIVEPFMRGITIPDRPLRVKFTERA
ncbi:hypothetical protein QZH41_004224 [Actinostola sp. cb2023]|nr:hypothetical protein QZH41_004224 [Actinostola sp. cb2023]